MEEERSKENDNKIKEWESIISTFISNPHESVKLLTDDKIRIRIQFFAVYIMFAVISTVMTIINVITGFKLLMVSTLIFAILSILNIAFTLISNKTEVISRYLFAVELLLLFAFFIISGEPEGFSIIWIALLPTSGLLLYRLKSGTIISGIELLVLIFFLWTDLGNSFLMFPYTELFKLRYPILYIAFFLVGAFFEYIRANTQKELIEARVKSEFLSRHDVLTGLYNRYGFNQDIEMLFSKRNNESVAFAIVDLDFFKKINDRYGHVMGDVVLKRTAQTIIMCVEENGQVSRWGGEEFSILFSGISKSNEICNKILMEIEKMEFECNDEIFNVTASIGLVNAKSILNTSPTDLFTLADNNLYEAKEGGRNRIVFSEMK